MQWTHIRIAIIALGLGFVSVALSGAIQSSRRMPDGKQWTMDNLNVKADPSYCYDDTEPNCRRYGRLYTWESAQRGCRSLGDGWRLPTTDDWTQLAKHYGGVRGDSNGDGHAAYKALSSGGSAGFNALLGGGRSEEGEYARLARILLDRIRERSGPCVVLQLWQWRAGAQSSEGRREGKGVFGALCQGLTADSARIRLRS